MAARELPSQAELRQILRYEPETGRLFWLPRGPEWFTHLADPEKKSRIWNGRNAGREAFTASDHKGYLQGQVLKYHTMAHRVIWAMHFGDWPEAVDHINGDGLDNRIENLRSVTHRENCRNAAIPVTNSSGVMGVRFHKGVWEANIRVDGRQLTIGCFGSLAEAADARKRAEAEYGYHRNHGRPAPASRVRRKRGASVGESLSA
jgi:hypothetical protein